MRPGSRVGAPVHLGFFAALRRLGLRSSGRRASLGRHGLRIARGTRILVHGEVNYFPAFDLDRYGSDLELGGASLSLALEVRL